MNREPFIIQLWYGSGVAFEVARDTPRERQYWSAKHGSWINATITAYRPSRFRSREAAELEIGRIKCCLTPTTSKKVVRECMARRAAREA